MNSHDPARPSPDALLRHAAQESRGRLKIFLGASPGVGKTYEMLLQGAARLHDGIDVVIGVVETHGRIETERLVAPFEVIPRSAIAYHGRLLSEMDIDGVLLRRPALVLVDELAHSNAPEARHPKRWQDIEELRDAGIDVFTTVNIQHIDSLTDIVAGFTHVRVRETVPDHILESAELEIVDLPPDELIERLKAGKVYIREEATRALHHFFSKSNLSALRELALRRAAQSVDAQMLDHLRAHALGGTYAGGERILVAVSELAGSDTLVRTAKRLSDALRAPWTALHVETPRDAWLTAAERERLATTLALAASLGATIVTIPAATVIDGMRDQLAATHATQVVIGKSQRSWWFELRHGSVVDRLVRASPGVAIHVIPAGQEGRNARPRAPAYRPVDWRMWRNYAMTIGAVAALTAIALLINPWIGYQSIDLLYLVPVVACASRLGLGPGILAGVVSGLAYNFFFLPPVHTLTIYDPQNVVTVVVLIAVAVLTSHLAGRARAQALLGGRSARENAAIAGFAKTLGALSDETETAQAICAEVARVLDVETVLLVRDATVNRLAAACPPASRLSAIENAAVDWVFDRGEPAGRGTGTLTASEWQFRPLATSLGVLAVLGIARGDTGEPISADRMLLLTSLIDQAALAHERLRLEAEMRAVASVRDRDELRATLLSSIGHDLRTPLTAIGAAADALADGGRDAALVATIRDQARRLARFFDDLIEITRIESGALAVRMEPIDLTDAVASAVHDMRTALSGRSIELDVPPNLPLVRADPRLLGHILINLIDNAAKFGTPATPIRFEGRRGPDGVNLTVIDRGPGLPDGMERRVFDRFHRLEGSDRTGGTGLGLAIVKGFAHAMHLVVTAANRDDGNGASFTILFPQAAVLAEPA